MPLGAYVYRTRVWLRRDVDKTVVVQGSITANVRTIETLVVRA